MARLSRGPGGPRGTKVQRTPYWVPDQNQWLYLPTGSTHRQRVEQIDSETHEVLFEQDQYEAKGWIPVHRMASDDVRLKELPANDAQMRRDHKTVPQKRKQDGSEKAA